MPENKAAFSVNVQFVFTPDQLIVPTRLERLGDVTFPKVGEDFDPDWFRSSVLPDLVTVTLPTIAKATGMSTSAAAKVRAGRRVPHARHWAALAHLASIAIPADRSGPNR
jgi:hypothetical protein